MTREMSRHQFLAELHAAKITKADRDELVAQIKALTEANAILLDHIGNIHNSVRHRFSAAVEAAADAAFKEMSGIAALRAAHIARTGEAK